MNKTHISLCLGLWLTTLSVQAQPSPPEDSLLIAEDDLMESYQAYLDSVVATFRFHHDTTLLIGDGLAELTIPAGYQFLAAEDGKTVLTELWGNPPENSEGTLGMLFPKGAGPEDQETYGIDIFFSEDGYISDEDALDIDYDDLLISIQEDLEEINPERIASGYPAMHLVGWAAPPHYDEAHQRLHWAKELQFGDDEVTTLNYNVLFLGRRGYLTMNVIGDMDDVPEVTADLNQILASVNFTEGNRYGDFDASIDEVAAYGIGALIAGKMLAKTGLLATMGIFLLKGWKLILIGFIAFAAGLKKVLGK